MMRLIHNNRLIVRRVELGQSLRLQQGLIRRDSPIIRRENEDNEWQIGKRGAHISLTRRNMSLPLLNLYPPVREELRGLNSSLPGQFDIIDNHERLRRFISRSDAGKEG